MKTDMTGAAVALATVLGAAAAGVAHRVTAVLPLAENHVGGASYRPGDVLTMCGGTTVEIANTDAEGRLVLADALAWADATLDPDVLIDVATLTGAATARARQAARRPLLRRTTPWSTRSSPPATRPASCAWHMPLVEEYEEAVRSRRRGPAARAARQAHRRRLHHRGAVPAALRRARARWAHLDIAGPARVDRRTSTRSPRVRPGFGARLLLRYLDDLR